MEKSNKLLKLCRGLAKVDKNSQNLFIDGVSQDTLHQISEIFYNMQYFAHKAPIKIRKKLCDAMRNHAKECKYISKKQGTFLTKRKYLKKQVGNGLFSLLISAAIPIISSIISAIKKR